MFCDNYINGKEKERNSCMILKLSCTKSSIFLYKFRMLNIILSINTNNILKFHKGNKRI